MIALVVEDEPLTAMLAASLLRDFGYKVFEARTVGEALSVLEKEQGFTLLFSDIELADGSSGVDLATEVAEAHPDIRIVVTSGRSRPATLPNGAQFVPKPYSEQQLTKALRG
jgi:CheY-like chemotaxis protein